LNVCVTKPGTVIFMSVLHLHWQRWQGKAGRGSWGTNGRVALCSKY